ncbi:hypothetical protein GCM10027590_04790 [Nocardiopsis nanhaiensis]
MCLGRVAPYLGSFSGTACLWAGTAGAMGTRARYFPLFARRQFPRTSDEGATERETLGPRGGMGGRMRPPPRCMVPLAKETTRGGMPPPLH